MHGDNYGVIDAAADFPLLRLSVGHATFSACLLSGDKGYQLSDVAPHLLRCDGSQIIEKTLLASAHGGVLIDSAAPSPLALMTALRRRQTVIKDSTGARVFFRYYDPRVLRAFLPSCSPPELLQFYGSEITAFHCLADDPHYVLTFTHDGKGQLEVEGRKIDQFLKVRETNPTHTAKQFFDRLLVTIHPAESESLYLLVNTTRHSHLPRVLRGYGQETVPVSLPGTPIDGKILLAEPVWAKPVLRALLLELWGKDCCAFLKSTQPIEDVAAFLGRQLLLRDDYEGDAVFGLHQPSLARQFFEECPHRLRSAFLGPVDEVLLESADATALTGYRKTITRPGRQANATISLV